MKIIHLISGLRGGGAEHLVLGLCKQSITDLRIQMKVVTLSGINDIAWKFREAGIEVLSATMPFSRSSMEKVITRKKSLSGVFRSIRLLLKENPEVIHAHMYHAGIAACIFKLVRPGTKVLFTLHNNHQPRLDKRVMLYLLRPFRNADIIYPGSPPAWYQKKNAVAIPNGIEVSRYREGEKPTLFTCLFVGRLDEQKNPLFLVQLASSLKRHYRFIIRVAGDGPLLSTLQKAIEQQDLFDYFECLGYHNDVPGLLSASHCLVMPSKWEGMPLALLEAAASGIPVIASIAANSSAVLDSSRGYIGNLNEFEEMLSDVMDNYGEALVRARKLKEDVRSGYRIQQTYELYLPLWLGTENSDKNSLVKAITEGQEI